MDMACTHCVTVLLQANVYLGKEVKQEINIAGAAKPLFLSVALEVKHNHLEPTSRINYTSI
jgi:hypothetical protein